MSVWKSLDVVSKSIKYQKLISTQRPHADLLYISYQMIPEIKLPFFTYAYTDIKIHDEWMNSISDQFEFEIYSNVKVMILEIIINKSQFIFYSIEILTIDNVLLSIQKLYIQIMLRQNSPKRRICNLKNNLKYITMAESNNCSWWWNNNT